MDHPLYRELLAVLARDLEVLPDKPDETPANTLACLWNLAAGQRLAVSQIASTRLAELDEPAAAALKELIARRLSGVPLAHLTGRQDFMGIVLQASAAALVPRLETELLGWSALAKLRACEAAAPWVVDLCTGCGNVALGLAVHAPHAKVWGSDLSVEAIALARDNARFVGRPDVVFYEGDFAKPFDSPEFLGRVDVLTCNPPYISSGKVDTMPHEIRSYEPRLAFDGGPFGIGILQRLLKEAPRLLKPGGWLVFEVGLGQGDALQQRLSRLEAFAEVEAFADADGAIRALAARRRSATTEGTTDAP